MSKKILFLFLLITIALKPITAQEMNGYVHSNYSGITGAQMNPTSLVNSRLYFDLNIIGVHINVDNNYIFLANDEYKFTRFLSLNPEFPEHEVRVSQTRVENRVYYDFFNEELKNAFTQVKVYGPSMMYSKNNRAFGFATSLRNIVSGKDIPYEIAKFGAEGFDYYPLHRIRFIDNKSFRASGISFGEIALSYAQVIHKRNRDHITAGITVKGLLGFGGGYWSVDNVDYMLPNGDTIVVYNANGKAGMSLPVNYANNDVTFPNELIKGTGIGADIGITYQYKMQGHTNKHFAACEQPFEDYHYSIGLSLIDIGFVNFKKNTKQIELIDARGQWNDFTNQDIETVNVLFGAVSNTFGSDSTALVNEEPFKIFLPSAVSAQFDLRIQQGVYLNSTLVYPLLLNEYTIARPAQLSLTPRIERDNFELAIPFTLYEFRYPRIGLSARFSKFIIGTDKLGGFFGLNHFTGMDLYFMIKFPLIKGNCFGRNKRTDCNNLEFRRMKRSMEFLKIR